MHINLKSLFAIVLLMFAITQTNARTRRGYIKKNGTYVAGFLSLRLTLRVITSMALEPSVALHR